MTRLWAMIKGAAEFVAIAVGMVVVAPFVLIFGQAALIATLAGTIINRMMEKVGRQPKLGIGLALAITLAAGFVIGRASVDTSPRYEIRTARHNGAMVYRMETHTGVLELCRPEQSGSHYILVCERAQSAGMWGMMQDIMERGPLDTSGLHPLNE